MSRRKRDKDNRKRSKEGKKKLEGARQAAAGHLQLGGPVEGLVACRLKLRLAPPNFAGDFTKFVEIEAIVDTGATRTAINPVVAARLGLPVVGSAEVWTANGKCRCPRVLAAVALGIGELKYIKLIEIVVADGLTNDMLFGMDLLRGGILKVDLVAGRWQWNLMRLDISSIGEAPTPPPPRSAGP